MYEFLNRYKRASAEETVQINRDFLESMFNRIGWTTTSQGTTQSCVKIVFECDKWCQKYHDSTVFYNIPGAEIIHKYALRYLLMSAFNEKQDLEVYAILQWDTNFGEGWTVLNFYDRD